MRILYAIQATGNGHISRAQELLPILSEHADVEVLLSGYQENLRLDHPVRYRFHGLSFIFGRRGGIDYYESFKRLRWRQLLRDIRDLDVSSYDLVLSDYEPVGAWAALQQRVPSIAMSHQISLISPHSPKPPRWKPFFNLGIQYMAPCSHKIGFHFRPYDDYILAPIIRRDIRSLQPYPGDHICVYLPSYSGDRLMAFAKNFPNYTWWIFDKHSTEYRKTGSIHINPVSGELWLEKLQSASAVLMGAGFEGPSEALFLNKKLLVVPMKGQPEQHHNAAALARLGVPSIPDLHPRHLPVVERWLSQDSTASPGYYCDPDQVVHRIFEIHRDAYPQVATGAPVESPLP